MIASSKLDLLTVSSYHSYTGTVSDSGDTISSSGNGADALFSDPGLIADSKPADVSTVDVVMSDAARHCWYAGSEVTDKWILLSYSEPFMLTKFTMSVGNYVAGDNLFGCPCTVELLGSNDQIEWTAISTVSKIPYMVRPARVCGSVDSNNIPQGSNYSRYRWVDSGVSFTVQLPRRADSSETDPSTWYDSYKFYKFNFPTYTGYACKLDRLIVVGNPYSIVLVSGKFNIYSVVDSDPDGLGTDSLGMQLRRDSYSADATMLNKPKAVRRHIYHRLPYASVRGYCEDSWSSSKCLDYHIPTADMSAFMSGLDGALSLLDPDAEPAESYTDPIYDIKGVRGKQSGSSHIISTYTTGWTSASGIFDGTFTISFWVYDAHSSSRAEWVLQHSLNFDEEDSDNYNSVYDVLKSNRNGANIWSENTGSQYYDYDEATGPGTRRWMHEAYVYDGTNIKMYIDGWLAGERPVGWEDDHDKDRPPEDNDGSFDKIRLLFTVGSAPVSTLRIYGRALPMQDIELLSREYVV